VNDLEAARRDLRAALAVARSSLARSRSSAPDLPAVEPLTAEHDEIDDGDA
jgi:hypothetical protein